MHPGAREQGQEGEIPLEIWRSFEHLKVQVSDLLLIQLSSLHYVHISGVKFSVALLFIVSLPMDLLDPNVN